MRLFWRELNKSKVEIFIDKINKFLGFKKKVKTRLIVSENELVLAAQKMHDKMFLPDSNGLPILLDQGGSGWNPVESTKYYSNCKIVIVTRDPRDQFAEIKAYKEGGSVNGFIDWYNEMQRRHKFIKNDNILFIKFEDFIKDNKSNKVTKNIMSTYVYFIKRILKIPTRYFKKKCRKISSIS